MRLIAASILSALLVTVACSSSSGTTSTTILASSYDQRCNTAADCSVVSDGDVCGCLGCGNAAVNQSAVAQYQADASRLRAECPARTAPCPAIACILVQATCTSGVCQVCHSTECAGGGPDAGHD